MTISTSVQTFTDTEMLNLWRLADAHLATGGQSYTVGNRTVTLADAKEIRERITFYQQRVADATEGSRTILGVFRGAV